MLTSIEIMETTKKFRVPTVEEMEGAAELMSKDAPTSHFMNNKVQAGSTSGESVKPTPSEAVIPSSSSHPLAALKKSAFYDQVQDEFRTMIQNEMTTKVETSTLNAQKPIPTIITNKIVVNPRQRGNPVLKGICNVPWEFGEIVPDYVMGRTTCALFLSLRYHSLNPDYIQDRIKQLGNNYELRVLLVQVDVKDCQHALNQLMKISILMNMTLILAWSPEEAGRHLETYKIFQHKGPDILMKKQDSNNCSKVIDALTSVKSINRSDAVVLLDNFKTLEGIINASIEQLSFCPGIGTQKAKRLYSVLHENFLKSAFK